MSRLTMISQALVDCYKRVKREHELTIRSFIQELGLSYKHLRLQGETRGCTWSSTADQGGMPRVVRPNDYPSCTTFNTTVNWECLMGILCLRSAHRGIFISLGYDSISLSGHLCSMSGEILEVKVDPPRHITELFLVNDSFISA